MWTGGLETQEKPRPQSSVFPFCFLSDPTGGGGSGDSGPEGLAGRAGLRDFYIREKQLKKLGLTEWPGGVRENTEGQRGNAWLWGLVSQMPILKPWVGEHQPVRTVKS